MAVPANRRARRVQQGANHLHGRRREAAHCGIVVKVAEVLVDTPLGAHRVGALGAPERIADQTQRQRFVAMPGIDQRKECLRRPAELLQQPAREPVPLGLP